MSGYKNKKDELIFAAISCFTKYGFDNTSIDMILEETKYALQRISRRTFYKYFKSKQDILKAVKELFSNTGVKDYYREKIAALQGESKEDKIHLFINQIFFQLHPEFINVNKLNFRLLFDPDMQEQFDFDYMRYTDAILEILIDLLDEKGVKHSYDGALMLRTFLRGVLFEVVIQDINQIDWDQVEYINIMRTRVTNYIDKIVLEKTY